MPVSCPHQNSPPEAAARQVDHDWLDMLGVLCSHICVMVFFLAMGLECDSLKPAVRQGECVSQRAN